MAAQREPRQLVPETSPLNAMREAADKAIWDLGGYQEVATKLHTSADFLRQLRASRRRADLADLVVLIGRCTNAELSRIGRQRAVENRERAGGKQGIDPKSGQNDPQAVVAGLPGLDPLAAAVARSNRQVAMIVGIAPLAALLGLTPDRLRARLAGADRELADLIEAVVIPDIHRSSTSL
jgi:hypothetical protein